MAIKRNISVLNQGVVADIDIVYGSDLVPIEFYITDYVIPSNAIATLYCTTPRNNVYKRVGTILNNVISFEITKGFFEVGKNRLQIRITADEKNLYSFESNVNCKANNATDDASEVKSQPTLVEQLLTDVANTNKKVEDALLEVEETKQAFETKVDESVAQLSNPNLFINGNFQIWSNEESFDVYGVNNEEYTTAICDRWLAKHYDIYNVFYITKEYNGLRIASASQEECYIYQVLDEETFNALQGKTLTLSYSYTRDGEEAVEESIEIVVGRELDVFTAQTRISLTNGCVLHWAKLEVGTVQTQCIPDSKDAIICKLEKNDYITEQGADGIWTYRKWKSGIAECFGKNNFGAQATFAVGALYNTNPLNIELPTALFATAPYTANITLLCGGGVGAMIAHGAAMPTKDGISNIHVVGATNVNFSDLTLGFHVIGRWK